MVRLSYFAAQEIPAALLTFVSLLLFIQTGTSPALSTMYSALLSVPWMTKTWIRRTHPAKPGRALLLCESAMVLVLLLLAAALSPSSPLSHLMNVGSGNGISLFTLLFVLSLSTAWHEILADNYYHDQLKPRIRRFYDAPRLFVSQTIVVVTYGVLIIFIGTMQVLTRSILVSWTTAFIVLASVMLLFVLWHLPSSSNTSETSKHGHTTHPPLSAKVSVLLFLFFLPQALMFYTRVIFLLSTKEQGGLSRSLQDVGFVHGVIGALAFSLGLVVSRSFVSKRMHKTSVGRRKVRYSQYALPQGVPSLLSLIDGRVLLRFLPLLLSPILYCYMSYFPPKMLWQIAVCTFLAQFMFGYGMHRLLSFLGLPASIGLRVPVVAAVLFVPLALSGWIVGIMDFQTFFLIDSLTALLPLIYVAAVRAVNRGVQRYQEATSNP